MATERYALIAGNGKFPFLVLEAARHQGIEMVVLALKEETFPEIADQAKTLHWVSLGELSRALEILRKERVTKAVMAGQVQHKQIFSSIAADPKLLWLLASLPQKSTDAVIGAISKVLAREGIELVDSTRFLKPLLAPAGVLTQRSPTQEEFIDIAYGRGIAREIARMDLGQTVVICQRACVAIEAMEGTDAAIERAGQIVPGGKLVVVKVSKPQQDMRFDVPVVGLTTIETMRRAGATALALDAGRTLLFEREEMIHLADQARIAVVADEPPAT